MLDALLDDLNTPKAIAEMHGLRNAAGRKALAGTLGFFGFRPDELKAWQASHAPQPALSKEEIIVVNKRLKSLPGIRQGIPAGVDPTSVRMNRKGLRGR